MSELGHANAQSIEIIKQPVARLLINYYWVPVLLSLCLYPYQKGTASIIELSYYPLYLVVGSLIKSFVQKRIVSTFYELHQTGCLGQRALQTLANRFERRLNLQWANIFGIVSGSWTLWLFYGAALTKLLSGPLDQFKLWSVRIDAMDLINAIDVLLGYAVGVATWKAVVTGIEIRRLGLSGDLRIRPFYPDGCAGLASIGQLLFALSLILITIGLFFCAWLFYARRIDCGMNINPSLFYKTYCEFEPIFVSGVAGLAIVSTLTLFLPMVAVHRLMKTEAARFKARLLPLADRISDFEESLFSQQSDLDPNQWKDQHARIELLRSVYSQRGRIPSWPIDFHTHTKFFSAQFALWIGILSNVDELHDLMKAFTKSLSITPSM